MEKQDSHGTLRLQQRQFLKQLLFLSMEIFPVASGRLARNVNLGMCLTATEWIGVCAERDWVTRHPLEVLATSNAYKYLP